LMAPYLKGMTKKEISQTCQTFLYELNSKDEVDDAYTVNFDTDVPEWLKSKKAVSSGGKLSGSYADHKKEAGLFIDVFLEVMKEGDANKRSFRWPNICIKHSGRAGEFENLPRPCYFSRAGGALVYKNMFLDSEDMNLLSVSVNLLKLAWLEKGEGKFFDSLESRLGVCEKAMAMKKDIIDKKFEKSESPDFLKSSRSGGYNFVVNFTGLPQAAMKIQESSEFSAQSIALCEKTCRVAQKELRSAKRGSGLGIKLGAGADIDTLTRFTDQNKKMGINQDVSGGLAPPAADEKLGLEANRALQPYFDAGAFYETNSKNLLKSKDFLYIKLF
ncbi:MAG: anaerobic ribonucleoside-triphosphate reductase, partial [Candidatus Micrarchaeota archaeon]